MTARRLTLTVELAVVGATGDRYPDSLDLATALAGVLPFRSITVQAAELVPASSIAGELDPQLAEAGAAEGIARSYNATPPEWKEQAARILGELAARQPEVVSDDVWAAGLDRPPNSATALGAIFRQAARAGTIRKTDRVRRTDQARSHGSPMTVWASLVYAGDGFIGEELDA